MSTIRDLHDGQLDLVLLDVNTEEYLPTFIKLQKTGLIGKGQRGKIPGSMETNTFI